LLGDLLEPDADVVLLGVARGEEAELEVAALGDQRLVPWERLAQGERVGCSTYLEVHAGEEQENEDEHGGLQLQLQLLLLELRIVGLSLLFQIQETGRGNYIKHHACILELDHGSMRPKFHFFLAVRRTLDCVTLIEIRKSSFKIQTASPIS